MVNLTTLFQMMESKIINFNPGDSYATSVAIQSDGKIVVAGYAKADGRYKFPLQLKY